MLYGMKDAQNLWMMSSPGAIVLSAILLAYGLYAASYIPGLLVGTVPPILLIGRVVEAVLAFAAAFGVWTRRAGASASVLALAAAIAIMWLVEGFVLGIVAYLYALGAAILVMAVGVACASYISHLQRTTSLSRAP